jgi:hypothetical protein
MQSSCLPSLRPLGPPVDVALTNSNAEDRRRGLGPPVDVALRVFFRDGLDRLRENK